MDTPGADILPHPMSGRIHGTKACGRRLVKNHTNFNVGINGIPDIYTPTLWIPL